MAKIFLSYRRQDSAGVTGRIYDRLRAHFGDDAVFMDIDNIPFGVNFRKHIDTEVSQCDVVLAVIGIGWAGEIDAHRRIDDPKDFVRIEVESALKRDIPVIPILIDRTRMPTEAELPPSLIGLASRNAIDVDQGRDFHLHVDRLIQGIGFHFQRATIAASSRSGQGAARARQNTPRIWPYAAAVAGLACLGVIIYIAIGDHSAPGTPDPSATVEPKSGSSRTKVPSPRLSRLQSGRESTNTIGMKLVRIDAGEFEMGTSKDQMGQLMRLFPGTRFEAEQPQHPVKIMQPFYMGIHEVTQGQYQAVMGKNPSHFKGGDGFPVENVSWSDAVDFCNKLSELEKRTPFYRINGAAITKAGGNGYRLPTEAEWEYACRAQSTTLYFFGNDAAKLSEYAWYDYDAKPTTHPVGQKLPNAWGLYDMLGNVLEWCADGYDEKYYSSSPLADPPGAFGASDRVVRSGGWGLHPGGCRPARRVRFSPAYTSSYLGFRVAAGQE